MNQSLLQNSDKSDVGSARIVAITSEYGHAGRSSLLINFAVCLSKLGKSVCVFDSAAKHNGQKYLVNTQLEATTHDLIQGNILIEELKLKGPEGIDIIPRSNGIDEYTTLSPEQKQHLLLAFTQLQHDYEFVLIDTASGIKQSTISFLLGSGAIVITITPEPKSLNSAFSLLKEIKQRVFQQPVKVVVNLVSGENEAKQIIARLSVAVRKYLGAQCGGMSFFIFDMPMLDVMSDESLVSLRYPDSAPSQCLKNIVLRLTESGHPQSLMMSNQLSELSNPNNIDHDISEPLYPPDDDWISMALRSLMSEPAEVIDPIMQRLNEVWNERKLLQSDGENQITALECDVLNLKTAIHFASKVNK